MHHGVTPWQGVRPEMEKAGQMNESERLAQEAGEAQRRKRLPRSANPYRRGSAIFDLWDTAWCDEDDRLRQATDQAISDLIANDK